MCCASTSRAQQNTKICVSCGVAGACAAHHALTSTTQLSRQSHLPPTPHERGTPLATAQTDALQPLRATPHSTLSHTHTLPPDHSNSTDRPSFPLPVSPLDTNHQRRAVPLLLLRLLQRAGNS